MGRMFDVFHVSLLKKYRDGCRSGLVPPSAVLNDGETECEVQKILAHRDAKTGRKSYYVQWQGLPPAENEWLTGSKLKNAADVEQNYLDELNNKGRPVARVGRPNAIANEASDYAASDDAHSGRQNTAAVKPKRGRG